MDIVALGREFGRARDLHRQVPRLEPHHSQSGVAVVATALPSRDGGIQTSIYFDIGPQPPGAMSSSTTALPGQRLADAGTLSAGRGTYTHDGGIFASVLGSWSVNARGQVEVARAGKTIGTAQVLRLGDAVVCRAVKATARHVLVDILCVGETVLQEAFPGTIRLEDVRSHDVDKLVLEDMFRPGMLIKALVLSFGDTRSYFLSTAKPGLGIVKVQPSDAMETD